MAKQMVEGRTDRSPIKPTEGISGLNEFFCVQFANTKKGAEWARAELMKMLSGLSDEALVYVWRPIAYAYSWTDGYGMELLSEDDLCRMNLVGAAANESPELVDRLAYYWMRLKRNEWRCANGQAD